MSKKLYVGNLPFTTTEDDLRGIFERHGSVDSVAVITDRETGRPRGFAFVEFDSEESAEKAIEMFNEHELGGRALRVNMAEERQRKPRPYGGGPPGDFSGFDDNRGGGRGGFGGKPKGSRRNIRGKKRSL